MSKLNMKVIDMETPMLDATKKVTLVLLTLIQYINEAFENYREERYIANKIKEDMDKQYGKLNLNNALHLGPSWNVIVGKNFGSHVVHQTKSYLFASYGDDEIYILVWKAG